MGETIERGGLPPVTNQQLSFKSVSQLNWNVSVVNILLISGSKSGNIQEDEAGSILNAYHAYWMPNIQFRNITSNELKTMTWEGAVANLHTAGTLPWIEATGVGWLFGFSEGVVSVMHGWLWITKAEGGIYILDTRWRPWPPTHPPPPLRGGDVIDDVTLCKTVVKVKWNTPKEELT